MTMTAQQAREMFKNPNDEVIAAIDRAIEQTVRSSRRLVFNLPKTVNFSNAEEIRKYYAAEQFGYGATITAVSLENFGPTDYYALTLVW